MIPGIVFCLETTGIGADKTVALVKESGDDYSNAAASLFVDELRSLARDRFNLKFVEKVTGYDVRKIDEALLSAIANPDVDVVYASGFLTSERASQIPDSSRSKPIVAAAPIFTDLRTRPISREGTSAKPNFTFISQPSRIASDLSLLSSLTNSSVLHCPIDQSLVYDDSEVGEVAKGLQKELGIELRLYPTEPSVTAVLAAIPSSAKAVYIPTLPRIAKPDLRRIFETLAKRGAVTVSMLGREGVELGAMAGLSRDNRAAIARRSA
ncbi:MAG: hypothetical protein AAGH89_18490, partial [Verrucomicrobiota bacterium]